MFQFPDKPCHQLFQQLFQHPFCRQNPLWLYQRYLVDARGKVTAASLPMKLAPHGIEFAAGMGVDGDRIVVSFGVDDMECKIGETRLSAVLNILQEIGD